MTPTFFATRILGMLISCSLYLYLISGYPLQLLPGRYVRPKSRYTSRKHDYRAKSNGGQNLVPSPSHPPRATVVAIVDTSDAGPYAAFIAAWARHLTDHTG